MQVITDLRNLFEAVRDQGSRPTCLAFATSDTHAGLRPGWIPLSCEYLFNHSIKLVGSDPDQGTTFAVVLDVLRDEGQPAESDWPYLNRLPADLRLWKPPAGLGHLFRRDSQFWSPDFVNIVQSLNRGIPLVIGMSLSDAFFSPGIDGIITAREPVDRHRRHAVIGLGHGKQGQELFILVRNSWGSAWGNNGYAWVSQDYLEPRLMQVAELREDLT